jgi:copper chaperone NosL
MTRAWLVLVPLAAACAAMALEPARIDTANDACHHCRMIVSAVRTAAQIVAPGEEPRIFDDIGCLRDYLARAALADDAVRFVADHRTGAWVRAESAVFTKVKSTSTPMGSGIIAHADRGSRDADPAARDGEGIDAGAILGGQR